MTDFLKKLFFARFRSLKLSMSYALVLGLIFAVISYFAVQIVSGLFIEGSYLSEESRTSREEKYLDELQAYVDNGRLTSEDTDVLAEWVRDNRYLYVMIYKDNQLVLDSDSAHDPNEPPGEEDSGITVTFPTREDLIEYAKARDSFPIKMSDGVHLLVSMVDYTEYFYYDIFNIISVATAAAVLTLIIMLYFNRITSRITKLAKDVEIVASGDMDHSIRGGGGVEDKMSKLMRNVENMRLSLLDNIAKEREAIDANTELITSMSHDIRTPLTVMLGYIDIMKMNDKEGAMTEYLAALENTALRLKELSDDTFNYFLVFSDKYRETDIAEYEAGTLFEQIISEKVLLLRECGYEVEIDSKDGAVYRRVSVITDAPKLMRIAENLFSNIMKYADKAWPVRINSQISSDTLTVRITNRISHEGTTAESNGIGLRTCKKLSELSKIKFSAESVGDDFAVTLGFDISKNN